MGVREGCVVEEEAGQMQNVALFAKVFELSTFLVIVIIQWYFGYGVTPPRLVPERGE